MTCKFKTNTKLTATALTLPQNYSVLVSEFWQPTYREPELFWPVEGLLWPPSNWTLWSDSQHRGWAK